MTDLPAWLAASHAAANPRPAYSAFTERRRVRLPMRAPMTPAPRYEDLQPLQDQFFQQRTEDASRRLMDGPLRRLDDQQAQYAPDPIHTPLERNAVNLGRMVFPGGYDAGAAGARISRGEDAWGDLATNTAFAALPFLGVRGARGEPAPVLEPPPRYGANDRGLLERFNAIRTGGDDLSLPASPGFVNTEVYPARLWRRSSDSTFNRTNYGPGPEIATDTYASDNDGILHELIARLERGMSPEDLAALRWEGNPHAPPPGSSNVGDVPLLGSPDIAADPMANIRPRGFGASGELPPFMRAPNEDRYLFGRPPAEPPQASSGTSDARSFEPQASPDASHARPVQASDGNAASTMPVAELRARIDPFGSVNPWDETQPPIAIAEVRRAMRNGATESGAYSHGPSSRDWTRQDHINRIATLAREGNADPVRMTRQGGINDGMHRLAAAIVRGDATVPVDDAIAGALGFGDAPVALNPTQMQRNGGRWEIVGQDGEVLERLPANATVNDAGARLTHWRSVRPGAPEPPHWSEPRQSPNANAARPPPSSPKSLPRRKPPNGGFLLPRRTP